NVLEQAAMRGDSGVVDARLLAEVLRAAGVEPRPALNDVAAGLPGTDESQDDSQRLLRPLHVQVAELEQQAIAASLAANGGNKLATARQLQISRATLYARIDQTA
ncbi:MAG: helix-turn-helix domain-containing protein, partial [Comamonas sp.]